MPMVPTGLIHRAQLDVDIKNSIGLLGPEVARVAYSIGPDSTDVTSIFFKILLFDEYIHEDTIADLTYRISSVLLDGVHPIENWGLRPYFNFRSKSEQERRPYPEWE